jgi:hypothetical protein
MDVKKRIAVGTATVIVAACLALGTSVTYNSALVSGYTALAETDGATSTVAMPNINSGDAQLVYDGNVKTFEINDNTAYTVSYYKKDANDEWQAITKDDVRNAGDYKITVTLQGDYVWEGVVDNAETEQDETTAPLIYEFTINKKEVDLDIILNARYSLDAEGNPQLSIPEGTKIVESDGNYTAGEHSITLELSDEENYMWSSNQAAVAGDDVEAVTSTVINLKYSIGKMRVAKPEVKKDKFEYTGSEVDFNIPQSEQGLYDVEDVKAVKPGTYTVTVTLRDGANTEWADGSVGTSFQLSFEIIDTSLGSGNLMWAIFLEVIILVLLGGITWQLLKRRMKSKKLGIFIPPFLIQTAPTWQYVVFYTLTAAIVALVLFDIYLMVTERMRTIKVHNSASAETAMPATDKTALKSASRKKRKSRKTMAVKDSAVAVDSGTIGGHILAGMTADTELQEKKHHTVSSHEIYDNVEVDQSDYPPDHYLQDEVVERVKVIGNKIGEEEYRHFNMSFKAKLIRADEETKHFYTLLKNRFLSYKTLESTVWWEGDSIVTTGNKVIAKFIMSGRTLCMFLPLNAKDYAGTKYQVEDVEVKKYDYATAMFRVKNQTRAKYAEHLIADVAAKFGLEHGEEKNENYYLNYQPFGQLIAEGLIKEVEGGAKDN